MTKRIICSMSLAAIVSALALVPAAGAQSAKPASSDFTTTGTVTCSKYVYSRPERKGFTQAEAIRLCASQGYSYVLVSGTNVYTLQGAKDELAKVAGVKATVTGHVNTDVPTEDAVAIRNAVEVNSIAQASN